MIEFLRHLPDLALNDTNVILKLIISLVVGCIVGINNESHSEAVTLRTHVLIALGSSIFMITSTWMYDIYGINSDPARIGAQVVSGIGFLGAGAIIKYGTGVRGMTTAASIFITAALGLAAGAGYVWLCLVASIIVFISLFLLLKLERHFLNYYQLFVLNISTNSELDDKVLDSIFDNFSIKLKSREIYFNKEDNFYEYSFLVSLSKAFKYQDFHSTMKSNEFVNSYSIKQ